MYKFLIIILALASLACLQTTIPIKATPTTTEEYAGAVYWPNTPTETPAKISTSKPCARVTAIEAVHLRTDPTEHSQALTWLESGATVIIESKSNVSWFLVQSGNYVGFINARFLATTACPADAHATDK